MHDPITLAWSVKLPLPWRCYKYGGLSKERGWANIPLVEIWHVDPCKPGFGGSDDTCGWFMRAHHGDSVVLANIVKRFEEDWDRTWTYDPKKDGGNEDEQVRGKSVHMCGYFNPNGMPRMSVSGITLNLFFLAACEHFDVDGRSNWKKAKRFMRRHLFDIILFAENPSDSLHDTLTLKYGNDTTREDRIRGMASTIYGWILRAERPWWKHPRWHILHWKRLSIALPYRRLTRKCLSCERCNNTGMIDERTVCHRCGGHGQLEFKPITIQIPRPIAGWKLQIHALQNFKRWAFSKCCKCGRGFKWGMSVCTGSWHGTGPLWFRSERNVYHANCDRPHSDGACDALKQVSPLLDT